MASPRPNKRALSLEMSSTLAMLSRLTTDLDKKIVDFEKMLEATQKARIELNNPEIARIIMQSTQGSAAISIQEKNPVNGKKISIERGLTPPPLVREDIAYNDQPEGRGFVMRNW